MSVDVSPTNKNSTHHISLEDAAGTKYGLILRDPAAVRRQPKQIAIYKPYTQNEWSGGRGLKIATDDRSRFADSKRLNTRRGGQITLGGLETYTAGMRQQEQYTPADASGVTWVALTGSNRFAAYQVTASATGNRKRVYFWVRRRGSPGVLSARLKSNNSGNPGAELKLIQVDTDEITDTVSMCYEFTWLSVQAVTATTVYWVEISAEATDNSTNHWEVGTDTARGQAKTKSSSDGTTWANAAYDLYFRLVDDLDINGVLFFVYKSQLYAFARGTSSTTAKLYINGYRGLATGAGQSTTVLQDTTQNWPVNALAGKILLIIDGPNSEWTIPYRTIISNTANAITTSAFGQAHQAAQTTYVILGTDVWTLLVNSFPSMPTDIAPAGDVVYFAMGDTVQMRKMQERKVAGVWTRTFATEDNYAKLLLTYRDQTKGLMVMKANDYDNSNRPSVAFARFAHWLTRLKFPWLIDQCGSLSGWTFGANVTGTADTSNFQTFSASIKLACLTTAAAVLAYRTFSPAISLANQKRIRLWVYTSVALTPGQLKLRISAATDASTSLVTDIDFPALDAAEWIQVVLPYKDTTAGLTGVQSIGFIKNFGATAMDIYIDGIETLPDASEIQLGNDTERITGLELYGDPEVPWIFRSGSVGSIENGTYNPIPIREYSQVENIHNGAGHLVHDVYLYFSFLQGIQQYYRSNLEDIGPNRDEGLPAGRQGYSTSMVGYPDRWITNVDAGGSGYSSILSHKGGGFHEDYRCDAAGKRIRKLFAQIIPGDTADRLWFSEGEDIVYLPLPGNSVNELTDSTYRFTHEGVLEMGWIGDDQQRLFSTVRLGLENVSAARCIEWDYKLDEETTWTAMATSFTSGPVQTLSLNKSAKRLKLRFRLQSNSNTETPRITSVNVSTTERPDTRFAYSIDFVYSDNARTLLNLADNYTRAETLINQLDTWTRNNTPLTMRSISEVMDNKTVYLDPAVTSPISNQTDTQQEKLIGTITIIEPQ